MMMISSQIIGNERFKRRTRRKGRRRPDEETMMMMRASNDQINIMRPHDRGAPSQLERTRRRRKSVALFVAIAVIIFTSSSSSSGQAAVVRPTVFSDLNTSQQQDNNAVQQQASNSIAATPATLPQAQQTQQQQQQQQQSQQSNHNLNTLSAPPPSDASQIIHAGQQQHTTTKISPLKSRFCHSTSNNQQQQPQPLGLQSYAIDDLAISSSSSSNEQVKPHLARLNLDIRGGAWCPANAVHAGNFGKEWIQVKLNRSHVITAIETQGRFGNGNGKEYVPGYQIEYSRNGGRNWHKWKDIRGSNLLRANEDPNSAVKNELSPPIVGANVIRILPYSSVPRTVCMRLELHGCLFDEGAPIAYATKDGVVEPRWGHLIDYTYDGLRMPSGELSHGLGQLVDGVKGLDNFSYNNGFEWVGWKSMNGDVEIEFTFRTLRNFTGALFHSNNLFSNGVEVFQAVDVHYGIDIPYSMETIKDSLHEQQRRSSATNNNKQPTHNEQPEGPMMANNNNNNNNKQTLWSQDVLSIEYVPDKKSESSRPVLVHLKERLANKLKFVLKFASKWILVSEVEFASHPVELLSLASLSQSQTAQLMGHLQPAKSYDEYVAILREHQLRRLAAESLMFGSSGGSASTEQTLPSMMDSSSSNNDQPNQDSGSSSPSTTTQLEIEPYPQTIQQTLLDKRLQMSQSSLNGALPQWPPRIDLMPSTNPLLNGPNPFGGPAPALLFPAPPSSSLDFIGKANQFGSLDQKQQEDNNKRMSSSSPIGLTTVISFVLVLIVLALGLLFVISSYRMRCHQASSKLGRHLAVGAGVIGTKSVNNLMGPNFMSVFSSPTSQQQQQQQQPEDNISDHQQQHHHYNAIFANGNSHTIQRWPRHPVNAGATQQRQPPTQSALRRLATLAGSGSAHSNRNKSSHLFHQSPNSSQGGNQLLVSVKDSSSSGSSSGGGGGGGGLFGGNSSSKANQQGINTQLIIGLNQAQPTTNHIYNPYASATHYSTNSMSMASSSTNGGHQGDYGDYAIPDAVPIIPPSQPQHLQYHHQMHQIHQQQQQQQQQPFMSRLTHNGQQVRSTLLQQQQQQQHNYEPVYTASELADRNR